MYKRFLVFAWNQYYPSGGTEGIKDSFDTLEEAVKFAYDLVSYDYKEVFDCHEKRTLYEIY